MQINLGQKQPMQGSREAVIGKASVVIGDIKRESTFLDRDGNEINPRTRQIIKRKEE